MNATLTILGKDLRLRVRDRSIFAYGFLAPFVLAFVFGLVFADVDQPVSLRLGVVAPPGASLSDPLVDVVLPPLVDDGLVEEVVDFATADAAADAVAAGDADVALVVLGDGPAGPRGVEVLDSVDRSVASSVASAIARGLVEEADTVVVAVGAALAGGAAVTPPEVTAAVLATPPIAETVLVDSGSEPLDPRTSTAAGIAVFFLLFAVGISSTGILEEEREGTLARLRSAPIPPWTVLAAKAALGMVVGIASLASLAVATSLAMGAEWGAPLPLLLVIVAASAAAVGLVSFVSSLARTPESASNGVAIVAIVAGAVGGSFFPIAEDGPLAVVATITPHKWFLDGVRRTAVGGDVGDVLGIVGVLLLMAVVTGAAAMVRLRRRLEAT